MNSEIRLHHYDPKLEGKLDEVDAKNIEASFNKELADLKSLRSNFDSWLDSKIENITNGEPVGVNIRSEISQEFALLQANLGGLLRGPKLNRRIETKKKERDDAEVKKERFQSVMNTFESNIKNLGPVENLTQDQKRTEIKDLSTNYETQFNLTPGDGLHPIDDGMRGEGEPFDNFEIEGYEGEILSDREDGRVELFANLVITPEHPIPDAVAVVRGDVRIDEGVSFDRIKNVFVDGNLKIHIKHEDLSALVEALKDNNIAVGGNLHIETGYLFYGEELQLLKEGKDKFGIVGDLLVLQGAPHEAIIWPVS